MRLHQGMLILAAAAMMALVPAVPAGFALSAVVLGLAYGPMNPASTVLLARYTPPRLRARVFSLKQTAVPAGGALAGYMTPLLAAVFGWRAAALLIAAVCLVLTVAIQPWRAAIDRDGAIDAKWLDTGFWLPAMVTWRNRGLRLVALASFAFGAVQFSFSAVFPTVLVHAGWRLRDAGMILSVALMVGVVCRVLWGSVADRLGPRPILGVMGLLMSLAAFAAAFFAADWSGGAVVGLAALFGLSAFCWAGIGIAEAVRQVPSAMIPEASAGMITTTFLGALAGPALFSTATALAGSFRPAFLLLGAASAVPGLLLLWPVPQAGKGNKGGQPVHHERADHQEGFSHRD
jgi:MFS family permease